MEMEHGENSDGVLWTKKFDATIAGLQEQFAKDRHAEAEYILYGRRTLVNEDELEAVKKKEHVTTYTELSHLRVLAIISQLRTAYDQFIGPASAAEEAFCGDGAMDEKHAEQFDEAQAEMRAMVEELSRRFAIIDGAEEVDLAA